MPIIKINREDINYPNLLTQISDPPKTLYCRGNIQLLNTICFGVVGARKLTAYGKEVTSNIARDLSRSGFTVVSGLALGIDAIAHTSTLDFNGKTIAVLGSGVDDNNIFPRTNFRLAMDILDNDGLIISEYPEGFHANEKTFPQRNRIISGLSKGVIVIEADLKSGALITARWALEQNRDVFAIPGSIYSFGSIGTNKLIQRGAKLVSSIEDITEEYGDEIKISEKEISTISTKDPVEKNILAILETNDSLFIDEIVRLSTLETSKVIATLSILEIKGKIKNIGNKKYKIL